MALFFGNSYCKLCQIDEEQLENELTIAYSGMSSKGLSPPKDAYYSARLPNSSKIWTISYKKSGLSLFEIADAEKTEEVTDFETALHSKIYTKRPDVNAIFHVKSYYVHSATSNGFLETVHAEAALILGDIPIISIEADQDALIKRISQVCVGEPLRPIRVIVILKRGVIALGACIHESRAFIEILEEWAKYRVLSSAFGGTRRVITLDGLRGVGARHARSIKFGGRQATS